MLSGSDLCLDAKELSDDIIAHMSVVKHQHMLAAPGMYRTQQRLTEGFPRLSIDCKESGLDTSLPAPVVTALGQMPEFTLSGSLKGRPLLSS